MALGDLLRKVFGMSPRTPEVGPRPVQFTTYPIDQLLLHMQKRLGRVSRDEALSVPAVLRGRNLICSVSTLPLEAVDGTNHVVDHPLLRQIDPNTSNVVVLAQLLEDLLFDGVAWLRVTSFGWDGMPASAVRYAHDQVSFTPPKDYTRGYLPSGLATEPASDAGGRPGKGIWIDRKSVVEGKSVGLAGRRSL